jgi:hypothetical protein
MRRLLAWFARHPRLRNGLVFLAVVVVLMGGARLWTSGPDAVRVTITYADRTVRHAPTTVLTDRTIRSSTVAQRLQRDLAATRLIPYWELFSVAHTCPHGPLGDTYFHAAYTLTWYRTGIPVEQASVTDAACDLWREDGVFFRWPYGTEYLYADIDAALNASG